jgi:hypothetical protein
VQKFHLEPDGDGPYPFQERDPDGNLHPPTWAEIRLFMPDKAPGKIPGTYVDAPQKHCVLLISDHSNNYRPGRGGEMSYGLEASLTPLVQKTLQNLEWIAKNHPDRFPKEAAPFVNGKVNLSAIDILVHTPENVRGQNAEKFVKHQFMYEGGRVTERGLYTRQELSAGAVAHQLGLEKFLENNPRYPAHENPHAPKHDSPSTAQDKEAGEDKNAQKFNLSELDMSSELRFDSTREYAQERIKERDRQMERDR